jgi:hypothetical protein
VILRKRSARDAIANDALESEKRDRLMRIEVEPIDWDANKWIDKKKKECKWTLPFIVPERVKQSKLVSNPNYVTRSEWIR